jgi:hypothetical protein
VAVPPFVGHDNAAVVMRTPAAMPSAMPMMVMVAVSDSNGKGLGLRRRRKGDGCASKNGGSNE